MDHSVSAGPALANAAMIVAQGCPKRYTETLSSLYAANNLPSLDFTALFDQPETETSESLPEDTQESDNVQSILRHIEDVEELPASVNEVMDILTDFDTFENSTKHSVTDDSLLKIEGHQISISINALRSISTDSLLQLVEQPISFNTNYYTLSTMSNNQEQASSYHDLEDWFDEDLTVHDLLCPLGDDSIRFATATAPHLLETPMLSHIENHRITSCSTPSTTPHRLKRMISFRNRNTGLVSPPMRYSLSPKTRTKSASTWSQATVGSNKSVNLNRTKSTPKPVGVSKTSDISQSNRFSTPNKSNSIRMKRPPTPIGDSKHSLSFSTPIVIN